jgi:hypothetical protein
VIRNALSRWLLGATPAQIAGLYTGLRDHGLAGEFNEWMDKIEAQAEATRTSEKISAKKAFLKTLAGELEKFPTDCRCTFCVPVEKCL